VSDYRRHLSDAIGDCPPLPPLEIPLADAVGSRAVAPIVTQHNVPSVPVAPARAFAVVAADLAAASADHPVTLDIADDVPAGYQSSGPVETGQTVRLAPGAPVPDGADALIDGSSVTVDADSAVFTSPAELGGWTSAGSTFLAGDEVLPAGARLGHSALLALALCGLARIGVHPRPRVVIITVGSEWVRVVDEVAAGLTHEPFGVALAVSARALGADAFRVGPVPDEARTVRETVEDQLVRADMLITVGGIDDDRDIVRAELAATGTVRFDGPPLLPLNGYGLGRIGPDGTPIVALPDDPAAALLGFHALARPIIDAFRGVVDAEGSDRLWGPVRATLSGGAPEIGEGQRLVPGALDNGSFRPIPAPNPGAGALLSCNGMAVIDGSTTAGDTIEVIRWPG